MAMVIAPIDGAARSHPKPTAPTCKRSAKTGSRNVAPPRSTANKSSVITASRRSFEKTNLTPAMSVAKLSGSPRLAGGCAGSGMVSHRQTNVHAALTTNAAATLARAMISPPSAGPTTVAISNMLEFHVTALLKRCLGTNCGSIADRAGRANASATELSKTMP